MAESYGNCLNFKKHDLLSKDIYDCEMNNTYAKRLHYQQMKGMRLCNYKNVSYLNQAPQHIISTNDSMMEVERNDDRIMEIEDNFENEGENEFKYKSSSTQPPKNNDLDFSFESKSSETLFSKFCSNGSFKDESCLDSSGVNNNSFSSLNHVSSNISPLLDRYIPLRDGLKWQKRFSVLPGVKTDCCISQSCHTTCNNSTNLEESKDVYAAYSSLLRNELLDSKIESVKRLCEDNGNNSPNDTSLFHYGSMQELETNFELYPFSSSPLGPNSHALLRSPRKTIRKIPRIPYKVLDAPELQDDFYLNLVDWSSQNVLSVGLGNCVYLWSASTSQVTRLCDLSSDANSVTSVSWSERGNLVAVGTHQGFVQIWDVTANKIVSKLIGHSSRVGTVAWNGDILSSGGRDRMILQRDIRSPSSIVRRLSSHRQEVCGLKWSPDNQYLASGGNDNRLLVWNMHSVNPIQTYTEHQAAVKAIAWSPHQHGLLASGGGTADRCIRFWNTLTGQPMQCVDTGSQVCNLAWSKHSSEFVSTHGYSQNQVLVWKYPSLTQIAKLTGHSYRVLYLAMSPDGESIVTGAGDETLRFWNVFSKVRSQSENRSVLNLFRNIR